MSSMIGVLLVDDEKLALEYLEQIISWQDYGFKLVGVTTDARAALTLYKKWRPELVISDVKMPGMTGLELVSEIREYGGNTHILFLSAYKNFDYVKQAIRLDIDDYLLKSDLEEENFLKKILKLKEAIDKEKAKKQYTIGIILEEIFKKGAAAENYRQILDENDYVKLFKKYCYVLLVQKDAPRFLEKYIAQQSIPIESVSYECLQICKECCEDDILRVLSAFAVNEQEYLVMLEMSEEIVSEREMRSRISYFSQRVFSGLNQEKSRQFYVYYVNARMTMKQFGYFYQENKNRLSQRYLMRRAMVIDLGTLSKGTNAEREPASITADEIYQMLKEQDGEGIENCLQTAKLAMEAEDCFSYLWYVKNMFEAVSFFEGTLSGIKSGRKFSLQEGSAGYDFTNPQELLAFLAFKCSEIHFILRESENNGYSAVISEAMGYIRENHANPELSLSMIAASVNMSASWLSTKFKEEVGTGVNDFINGVRIEQGKKLFDKDEYMVYEVSERVGFASSQYFSKIFKEYVGVTPNQYRRKKKKDDGQNT